MKVHIITSANRAVYGRELEQMHRLRHEIFVEELGWTDLWSAEGVERDDFDDEHAVYLAAIDDGRVQGSLRLLPTWKRCMITERFPQWADMAPVEAGGGVWEWTRWCPGTTRRPRALIKARAALIVGALEFARSRGVETYLTFCETKFLPQLVELGWAPEPLGLPRSFDQGSAVAVRWTVRRDHLSAARRLFRMQDTTAFEAPACFDAGRSWDPIALEQRIFGDAPVGGLSEVGPTPLEAMIVQGRA